MFEILTALIVLFSAAYGCTFTIFIHNLHLKNFFDNRIEAYLKYGFLVIVGAIEIVLLNNSVNLMLNMIMR